MGIEVVGFTKNNETPLGKNVDYVIPMAVGGSDNAYMLYFTLILYLLSKRGEYADYALWKAQLPGVHEELIRIREEFDPRARELARKYHKEPYNMWVGSGSMWPNVYLFTMCLLEEMQWGAHQGRDFCGLLPRHAGACRGRRPGLPRQGRGRIPPA